MTSSHATNVLPCFTCFRIQLCCANNFEESSDVILSNLGVCEDIPALLGIDTRDTVTAYRYTMISLSIGIACVLVLTEGYSGGAKPSEPLA